MDRKHTITKNVIKSVIWNLLVLIVVISLSSYFGYNYFFPKEATPDSVVEGERYSFTAVNTENLAFDEDGEFIYLTLINDKKEVMDLHTKDEKKIEKLLKASEDNPVKVIGTAYLMADDVQAYMKDLYADRDINYLYTHDLYHEKTSLVSKNFFILIAIAIIIIVNAKSIVDSIVYKNRAFQFFKDNPTYNDREATKQIHKYVDIINEYIIVTAGAPYIVNIKESSNMVLTRHRTYFITTHYTLSFKNSEGKAKRLGLPKLKKDKAQEMLDYINNFYRA